MYNTEYDLAVSFQEGMEDEEEEDKMDEMQTTLKEYKETIGYLREKLNEVNLMNAKLLFTNKLFRGRGYNFFTSQCTSSTLDKVKVMV